MRKISVEAIRDVALKDAVINSKFHALIKLSGINSSSETKMFLLGSMIQMFMRLRTHSLSRDYIQKYKLQVKSLKRSKQQSIGRKRGACDQDEQKSLYQILSNIDPILIEQPR